MVAVAGPHGDREQNKQTTDAADHAPAPADSQNLLPVARDPLTIATHPPRGTPLSEDAARELTDRIRRDATALWMMLLRAYEGNAHGALGYTSWGAYCETELQIGHRQSYRLIDAARVADALQCPMGHSATDQDVQSTMVDSPMPTERVARELAPLLDDPASLRDTYRDAVETAPSDADGVPKVTAAHMREAVKESRGELRPRQAADPAPAKPRPAIGLNDAVEALERAVSRDPESAHTALAVLSEVAAKGLYGPQTKDAPGAFRGLLNIIEMMLKREVQK